MADQPDDLKALGEKIAKAEHKGEFKPNKLEPPSLLATGWMFASDMVAGLIVGFGLGWGVDWAFDHWSPWHTRPWGIVIMVVLGMVVGIRVVLTDAKELNARAASKELER